jgi:metallo-beta-lactamase family protein
MLADAMKFSGIPEGLVRRIAWTIDDLSWGFELARPSTWKRHSIPVGKGRAHPGLQPSSASRTTTGWSVLFSGDLGAADTPILVDPDPPDTADLVVMESTYGDRLHEPRDQRVRQLGDILTRALADNGKVFIPAFSLGRTQELIYEMDRIFSDPGCQEMFPDCRETAPAGVRRFAVGPGNHPDLFQPVEILGQRGPWS